MKRKHSHFGTAFGAVLLAVVMLVAVSPAASATGPLFHFRGYPEYQVQPSLPVPTIEGLYAANAYEALMDKYGGFGVESFANPDYIGAEKYSFFYGTEDFNFYCDANEPAEQPSTATVTTATEVFRLKTNEDGSTEFGVDWSVEPDWQLIWHDLRSESMALDEEALLMSEIVYTEDNGDGTLTLVLADAASLASLYDEMLPDAAWEGPEFYDDYAWEGPEFYDDYAWEGSEFTDDFAWEGWDEYNDVYGWEDFYGREHGFGRLDRDGQCGKGVCGPFVRESVCGDGSCSRGSCVDTSPFLKGLYPDWNRPDKAVPPFAMEEAVPPSAEENAAPPSAEGSDVPPSVENNDVPPCVENNDAPPCVEGNDAPPCVRDDAWYNTPAEESAVTEPWYDNTMSWYQKHPYGLPTPDVNADPEILTVLTVDAATLEIRKVEQTLVRADGSEELLMVQLMSYDFPQSALLNELLARGARYMTGEELTDTRTVTVIYDPDTAWETVCERTVAKGDLLYATFAAGYELCADKEGTPFVGGDPWHDVTVYAFPIKTAWPYVEYEVNVLPPEEEAAPAAEDKTDVVTEEQPAESEMPVVIVEGSEYDSTAAAQTEETLSLEALPAEIQPTMPLPEEEVTEAAAAEAVEAAAVPAGETPAEEDAAEEAALIEVPVEQALPVQILPVEVLPPEKDAAEGETAAAAETPAELPQNTEEAAELDFDEVNHRIFEANNLNSILSRHSSVEYIMTFEGGNRKGWPDYVYETQDMAYVDSPNTAVYVGNGRYYELIENEAGSELFYVFDFLHNYDPLANAGYEIVPERFEDWWSADDEIPAGCFTEDGKIHLITVSTEEGSRELIEDHLGLPYNGETVYSEVIADAETYEIRSFIYHMELDGQTTDPLIYDVCYDEPEDRACRNLRALAERDAPQVVTVTLVMNPGTEAENSQTMTVPAGSNVVYIAAEGMDMFEDPACTVPAEQWDRFSDHTYYMRPTAG